MRMVSLTPSASPVHARSTAPTAQKTQQTLAAEYPVSLRKMRWPTRMAAPGTRPRSSLRLAASSRMRGDNSSSIKRRHAFKRWSAALALVVRMSRHANAIAIAATVVMAATRVCAENRALFEIAFDTDSDGRMDRAVLVAPERAGFLLSNNEGLMLGSGERVDLYIYLGAGHEKIDPLRAPTVVKTDILGERNNLIFPLEARKGSLVIKTAYSLFSNFSEETITIVHRNGEFLIGGLTYSYEMKDGEQGDCDINFLSGKGVASKGLDGKKRPVRERLAPVKLSAWSEKMYPKACRP